MYYKSLDDDSLTDEETVNKVTLYLECEITRSILEHNGQSPTERILKSLSMISSAVGIGVIPSMFLAAKRLYDTGGYSCNFFNPLSENLLKELSHITADSIPALQVQNAP